MKYFGIVDKNVAAIFQLSLRRTPERWCENGSGNGNVTKIHDYYLIEDINKALYKIVQILQIRLKEALYYRLPSDAYLRETYRRVTI